MTSAMAVIKGNTATAADESAKGTVRALMPRVSKLP